MGETKSFLDLEVWQKAHKLVLEIYKQTQNFPDFELFGITSQLRRAAVSVPANLVEGYKRVGKADKIRFYNIAQSSLEETKYLILLATDLNYINSSDIGTMIGEVGKMLESYIKKMRTT
ncbi:MAG: four helix bundle protein [Bacteroidales bacterium]|nr:four helix bundle protein [Bacteroidales bacterium]